MSGQRRERWPVCPRYALLPDLTHLAMASAPLRWTDSHGFVFVWGGVCRRQAGPAPLRRVAEFMKSPLLFLPCTLRRKSAQRLPKRCLRYVCAIAQGRRIINLPSLERSRQLYAVYQHVFSLKFPCSTTLWCAPLALRTHLLSRHLCRVLLLPQTRRHQGSSLLCLSSFTIRLPPCPHGSLCVRKAED